MRRIVVVALAVSLAVSGCARGGSSSSDGAKDKVNLEPRFAPETTVAGGDAGSSNGAGTTSVPGRPTSAGGTTVPGASPSPATSGPAAPGQAVATTEASITDGTGDVTPSPLDKPPPWADLVAARLLRTAGGFELRVRLGGGAAPERTADDKHTMNIASFYDLDGDGGIDTEVWLNVASTGWGATWFDNTRRQRGGFQDTSGVAITVEGPEVVARFPLSHLVGAERFRWALASEWGRYETIGTAAAARDDLPDGDAAARFPGA